MYLQVAAVAQPQAGIVVDTLKQKGFPAVLGQGPNATIFRVMVGPFADAAALGKAKADLENAGFHPLVRK
jgi:cell division septation protein DedD